MELTMDQYRELRGICENIRDEQGEARTNTALIQQELKQIRQHLATLNGRTARSEDRLTALEQALIELRGGWKTITGLWSLVGGSIVAFLSRYLPVIICLLAVLPSMAQSPAIPGLNAAGEPVWIRLSAGPSGVLTVREVSGEYYLDVTALVALREGANVWRGMNAWPPTPPQVLTATDRIHCDANQVQISSAADIALTSTPTIVDGQPGDVCILSNVGPAKITLGGVGSNLRLPGATLALDTGQSLMLVFNPTMGDWLALGGTSAPPVVAPAVTGYAIQLNSPGSITPVHSRTYYWGCGGPPDGHAGTHLCVIPKSGTIRAVHLASSQMAPGSGETSMMFLRRINGAEFPVCSSLATNGARTQCSSGAIGTPVTAGEAIEIKWVTPAWALGPVAVSLSGVLWVE